MEVEASVTPSLQEPATTPAKLKELPDTFDHRKFNAVEFINTLFPTKESLVDLEPLIRDLQLKIRVVDKDILSAVRKQSSSSTRSKCGPRSPPPALFSCSA
mmetsp:Transcript_6744/g.18884  ORF Transcript_6744/g.18884 Transcript_6744/m.18884 type:complete len:101 (-) Transcript_6744:2659-2961(-)